MERATARARKAFKYPQDDDDEQSGREELDEEEQEQIITNLATSSTTSNDIYKLAFTLLPLLTTPLFIATILASSSTAQSRLLSLLSLTSLFATSGHMLLTPLATYYTSASAQGSTSGAGRGDTGLSTLSDLAARRRARAGKTAAPNATAVQKAVDLMYDVRERVDPSSPLVQAFPFLNFALVGVLSLAAWILYCRAKVGDVFWAWLCLPGCMLGLVLHAEWTIAGEEREVQRLGGLRYGYKGA